MYLHRNKNAPIGRAFSGGKGGIRTLGGHEAHNGFRDRPIQPLWHLPKSIYDLRFWIFVNRKSRGLRDYNLNFHARMQFGVIHLTHALVRQLRHERRSRFLFTMHKEHFLGTLLHPGSIVDQ